jgi:glycosyltransferase involved in cell wall biosynthesis
LGLATIYHGIPADLYTVNRKPDAYLAFLLDDPLVEFLGEIGEDEKQEFLGNATALLFPIDWPEPFGLVLIESMACGTPVIA